jgi:hypothetical protein
MASIPVPEDAAGVQLPEGPGRPRHRQERPLEESIASDESRPSLTTQLGRVTSINSGVDRRGPGSEVAVGRPKAAFMRPENAEGPRRGWGPTAGLGAFGAPQPQKDFATLTW